MCILVGGEAVRVSGTSIFARHCAPGRQVLVYSMRVFARTPTAMILPLPVVPGSGEQALRFIDLSGYAEFFEEMHAACRPVFEYLSMGAPDAVSAQLAEPLLKVEDVGDFEASFVPTVADLRRLEHWYRRSVQGAGAELRCAASANTLDPQARLHAMDVVGAYPNRDLWVG